MSEDKNIKPHNENGQPHGFWEDYWNLKPYHICYKCYFVNGDEVGYDENYNYIGELITKAFWLR